MMGDRIENELSVTRIFGDAGKPHIAVEPSTDIHLIRLGKSTKQEKDSSAASQAGAAAHRTLLEQFDADAAEYAEMVHHYHFPL